MLLGVSLFFQVALLYKQSGLATQSGQSRQQDARQPRNAPTGATLDLAGIPIEGKELASIVMVEFSDYECPFCQQHAGRVAADLDSEFVATGKVKHAFVNNPLPFHPHAMMLATAAICSGRQGRYWQMHRKLFRSQPKTDSEFVSLAAGLSLDVKSFRRCLNDTTESASQIANEKRMAKDLGLDGTPSFAIGVVDSIGTVHVKKLITGAQPLDVFRAALNEMLSNNTL
jgi:protein-disulfide isomerase